MLTQNHHPGTESPPRRYLIEKNPFCGLPFRLPWPLSLDFYSSAFIGQSTSCPTSRFASTLSNLDKAPKMMVIFLQHRLNPAGYMHERGCFPSSASLAPGLLAPFNTHRHARTRLPVAQGLSVRMIARLIARDRIVLNQGPPGW